LRSGRAAATPIAPRRRRGSETAGRGAALARGETHIKSLTRTRRSPRRSAKAAGSGGRWSLSTFDLDQGRSGSSGAIRRKPGGQEVWARSPPRFLRPCVIGSRSRLPTLHLAALAGVFHNRQGAVDHELIGGSQQPIRLSNFSSRLSYRGCL
jgi:hypothetical protein